jgi:hypothetical protein
LLWRGITFSKVEKFSFGDATQFYGYSSDREKKSFYFNSANYQELDLDIEVTLRPSFWGTHTKFTQKPEKDKYIYGAVETNQLGNQYTWWFVPSHQFSLLWTLIMYGDRDPKTEGRSKEEMLSLLTTRQDLKTYGERKYSVHHESVARCWSDVYPAIAMLVYYQEPIPADYLLPVPMNRNGTRTKSFQTRLIEALSAVKEQAFALDNAVVILGDGA